MVAASDGKAASCGRQSAWRSDPGTDGFFGCTNGIHLSSGTCPPFGLCGAGMWVRLTRRLADCIDGVNLSAHRVGDVFEVTRHEAELLVAEAWAVFVAPAGRQSGAWPPARVHSVKGGRKSVKRGRRQPGRLAEQLRTITKQIFHRTFDQPYRRRAEDRIRDDWHDAHATVVNNDGG
jgi:hypothetical protein